VLDFFRPITAPTTAPATEPATDATPLATVDAPLAIADGAAAIPVDLRGFGAAFAGFADCLALAFVSGFGLADLAATDFGFAAAALFAGALASFERAAIAGPAPAVASSAFDFPVLVAGVGFFIAVPRMGGVSIRNAFPSRKFRAGAIGAGNG